MAKLKCTSYSKAFPRQQTLFDPWPKDELEPMGNPAYEGVGYPAAGYGQRRRKVVPLALPKVAAPQLTNNGWEGKVPQGTIVTVGTLNPNSDAYTRAQVASLAGLGCGCTATDARMGNALRGLAGGTLSPVQSLANDIMNNAVSGKTVTEFTDKIVADERANEKAYNAIQFLKKTKPNDPQIPALERQQQEAWGQTNAAKFYAFLLPVMRERLVGRVSLPDYGYIRAGENPGVFSQVAKVLQDKFVTDAARDLMSQRLLKDSSLGLSGLGFAQFVVGGVVAAVIAAGIIAYLSSKLSELTATSARNAALTACRTGELGEAACIKALEATTAPKDTDWSTVVKYGAYGLGALVALQVISSIRTAIPAR